jgi:hypothetical protein
MSGLAGKEEGGVPFGKEPASEDYWGTHVRRSEGTAVVRTLRKWSWSAPPKGRMSEMIVLGESERDTDHELSGWKRNERGRKFWRGGRIWTIA